MIDPKICLSCKSTILRDSVDDLVYRVNSIEIERSGRVHCPRISQHVYFDGTQPPDACPYKLEHAISAGCKRSQLKKKKVRKTLDKLR